MAEVLAAQLPDGQAYFSPSPLRRSAQSQTSLFLNSPKSYSPKSRPQFIEQSEIIPQSISSSEPSSPRLSRFDLSHQSSSSSTPASSLSLDTQSEDGLEGRDADLCLPTFGFDGESLLSDDEDDDEDEDEDDDGLDAHSSSKAHSSVVPDEHHTAEDDTAVRPEPSQHVDYLSHDWDEEDIAASWRHIVSKRKIYGERSRLENASWRTWAKSKNNLKTVSPETLNWLKDCDVTWLYGPLQTSTHRSFSHQSSEPASRISKSNSFLHKKPILKKRSVSEVMLQKSLSASSLIKQAADAVQAQQTSGYSSRRPRPVIGRAVSDFVSSSPSNPVSRDTTGCLSSRSTSGLQTPDHGEKRHIRFDDKVEQCIAVDVKGGDDDEEDEWAAHDDDSSEDEGLVMMKASTKKKPLSRSNSRGSFSSESKTIAKLPSTTLKYRTDSPEVGESTPTHSLGFFRSSKLSPSPSQETLRPSNPTMNFLLPEDDDEDMSWEPSSTYTQRASSSTDTRSSHEAAGLRRTESGMFMPYDEDEDVVPGNGILGKMVDTVNTAKDIAHVIWNVGWRA